jgi:hypothetical protein
MGHEIINFAILADVGDLADFRVPRQSFIPGLVIGSRGGSSDIKFDP